MRNAEAVELGRQPRHLELELAQPHPAGFEPAVGDRHGRERSGAREDAGARQIWSFSRIGWTETTWSTNASEGAGSGCSSFETKPSFQTDTGCSRRTVADVSAVADPATGVAVYDSFGSGGWTVFGGTSVASPIIASVYALAGNTASINNNFPYTHASALTDVTSGSNGSCSPSQLCTARVGWDGPTGLGTPNGVGAF